MRARALAITLAVVAVLAAGFDHRIHDRDVIVSGGDPIPCARCHTLRGGTLVGRPDHGACFGACHGSAPTRPRRGQKLVIPPERLELCTSCHSADVLARPVAGAVRATYPPYVPDDFALDLGHARHSGVACTQCHGKTKGPVHRRCSGCHDGSGAPGRGPAMTACTGCHTAGGGSPLPPSLAEPHNTVTSTFSHDRHAARGGAGGQCATCHAEILKTDDSRLPRPRATSCAIAGCHDGKPVFSITASCTRCHTTPPGGRFEIQRFDVRYSHTAPHHAAIQAPCTACHPLGTTGEVLVSGHGPCTSCHADEFGKRDPKICFACHNAIEPWRPLVADRLPPERTEFGARLDHGTHRGACTGCHTLATSAVQLRPPRGHRACTTAGCHAVEGGPAPRLVACESCHQLGLSNERIARRMAAAWSVRSQFDHTPHVRGADGATIACTTCHEDLAGASLTALASPRKQTCVPCHDGRTAFSLTGTGCTRCHQGRSR